MGILCHKSKHRTCCCIFQEKVQEQQNQLQPKLMKESVFANDKPLWQPLQNEKIYHRICLEGQLIHKGKPVHYRINEVQFIKVENNKYIDLLSAKLEQIDETTFKLVKNHQSAEFKCVNKDTCDDWVEQVGRWTILDNFDSQFKIVRFLAQGAFGQVFQLEHRKTGKDFAMKTFIKENMKAVDYEAIKKEIQISRLVLGVPNTFKCVQLYENQYALIVTAEYLGGGNLQQYIETHKLSTYNVAQSMFRILKILCYMRSFGVMHRDIKLDNIVMRKGNDFDQVVLVDFGLADYYNEQNCYQFRKCGTPGYSAPELLCNRKYDYQIDVYSVGCVMFRLIMDRSPFKGTTYKEVFEYNQYGLINWDKFPKGDAMDLLKCLLQEDPKLRIKPLDALQHKFFEQLGTRDLSDVMRLKIQ